jgi:adenylate cyclase
MQPVEDAPPANPGWRAVLLGTDPALRKFWRIMRRMPGSPRCHLCSAPFAGPGAPLARLMGSGRWQKNPNYCRRCFTILDKERGGAEVECSLLFADVRGSTAMAERMSPADFHRLIQRFYAVAENVLYRHEAILDKFVGDEVMAIYIPALAGELHALRAVETGRALLRATGHGSADGAWLPIGIGVHTGVAFVGSMASPPATTFTALGDVVNVAARLASAAGPGELLVSDPAAAAAHLDPKSAGVEHRDLELKGKAERVGVLVIGAGGAARTVDGES